MILLKLFSKLAIIQRHTVLLEREILNIVSSEQVSPYKILSNAGVARRRDFQSKPMQHDCYALLNLDTKPDLHLQYMCPKSVFN